MTPTAYCKLVENKLGWLPPRQHLPAYRRYQVEAKRVKDKMATAPELFTFENLELAVELLWRERLSRSPLGVFAHVERAVLKARETEDDVEVSIRGAMAIEELRGDPDEWVTRFARAVGPFRREALAEWRATQCS